MLTAHDIVTLTISLVANCIVLDVFGTIVYVLFPVIAHATNIVTSQTAGINQFLYVSYLICTSLLGVMDVYVQFHTLEYQSIVETELDTHGQGVTTQTGTYTA